MFRTRKGIEIEMRRIFSVLVIAISLLAGCGGGGGGSDTPQATPTPIATPTPSPSATPASSPGAITGTTPSPDGTRVIVRRTTTKTPVGAIDYFLKLNGSDAELLVGEAGGKLIWSPKSSMIAFENYPVSGRASFVIVKISAGGSVEEVIRGTNYNNGGVTGTFIRGVDPLSFSADEKVFYFKSVNVDDNTGAYSERFYSFNLDTRLYKPDDRAE